MDPDVFALFMLALMGLAVGMAVYAVYKSKKLEELLDQRFELRCKLVDEVIEVIDEFAAEDHRTLDSMPEFTAAMGIPKMRGLEDYRNQYVERYQHKIRARRELIREHTGV